MIAALLTRIMHKEPVLRAETLIRENIFSPRKNPMHKAGMARSV